MRSKNATNARRTKIAKSHHCGEMVLTNELKVMIDIDSVNILDANEIVSDQRQQITRPLSCESLKQHSMLIERLSAQRTSQGYLDKLRRQKVYRDAYKQRQKNKLLQITTPEQH